MPFALAKISFKAYSDGQIVPAVKYALRQAFNKSVIITVGKKILMLKQLLKQGEKSGREQIHGICCLAYLQNISQY